MRTTLAALLSLAVWASASAAGLASISNQDAAGGLKEALGQGAGRAVDLLGRRDGFLGNAKVKIPLPDGLRQAEGAMRALGMGKQADELITAMNRAAEAAVPEARDLLVDAVKKMTVQDAKGILTGGDDSATRYFKRTTSPELRRRFLPIVKQATSKVDLAEKYNSFAAQGRSFGLKQPDLEEYVTEEALEGLFYLIGEEEKAIRKNPLGATGDLAKKVFGSLGR
jgi:hypothetical protein